MIASCSLGYFVIFVNKQVQAFSSEMATKFGRGIVREAFKQVTQQLERNNAPKSTPAMSKAFIDCQWVKFEGGRGGDGCISMLHLFANEFAGPDGGNGGNGGHIVLRANKEIKSLNNISRQYRGKPGVRGMSKNLYGANGEHLFVDVPINTIVIPAKPKELRGYEVEDPDKSDIIADLDVHGAMFIAARGGAGGRGNATFLTNENRHPRIAEAGAKGEQNTYELRLKVYAHVGLIGVPNAGKSTLLRTLTGAQVKVGEYAFTTLHPQVGTIHYDDFVQVAISDLPGLIHESHLNRGMGAQFLTSLQRCACLMYVIDLSANDPVGQFETLVRETELHRKGMSERPHLVFGNKTDTQQGRDNADMFARFLASSRPETKLVLGSAQGGEGLEELRKELRLLHDNYQAKNADNIDEPLTW